MRFIVTVLVLMTTNSVVMADDLLKLKPVGIALRGQDNRFVQANGDGDIAGATRVVGRWETFTMKNHEQGMVSFRAHNGKLWCFQDGKGEPKANREKAGPWEKLKLGYQNDGKSARFVTLKADQGKGQFVAMVPTANYKLEAHADKVGGWERFDLYNVFQTPGVAKEMLIARLKPEMQKTASELRKEFGDSRSHKIKVGGVRVGSWSENWSGHVDIGERKDLSFGDIRLLLHTRKLEAYLSVRDARLDFDYQGKVRYEIPGNSKAEKIGIKTGIAHTENFHGAAFVQVSFLARVEVTREGVFLRDPYAQDFQAEMRNVSFSGAIPNEIELNTDFVKRKVNEKLREEEAKFNDTVNAALAKQLKDKKLADFATLIVELQKLHSN